MADQYRQEMPARFVSALEDQSPGQSWFMDGLPLATFILLSAVLTFAALAFMRCRRPQGVQQGLGVLRMPGNAADNNEWWTRVQWALEATTSGSERKYSYGVSLLIVLAKSKAAGPREKAILDAVWRSSATRMEDSDILQLVKNLHFGGWRIMDNADDIRDSSAAHQNGDTLRILRREILAARLKVVLDEQLNRESSALVRQLADMSLPALSMAG